MNSKLKSVCLLSGLIALAATGPAPAGVKTAEKCMEDVEDLERKMHRDRQKYTPESIRAAEHDLDRAKRNRKDHVECRKHYRDAEDELKKGKHKKH